MGILDCDKLPGLIRPREELQSFRKFRFSSPSLDLGADYQLVCQCGAVVGSVRPARVLPLPSMSWKSNSLDWFCCAGKLSEAPPVCPRSEDILYNSYSFAVSQTSTTPSTTSPPLTEKK